MLLLIIHWKVFFFLWFKNAKEKERETERERDLFIFAALPLSFFNPETLDNNNFSRAKLFWTLE